MLCKLPTTVYNIGIIESSSERQRNIKKTKTLPEKYERMHKWEEWNTPTVNGERFR